jgi:predicted hotdog family 3-hydroxylacyl-ACP dehydratase
VSLPEPAMVVPHRDDALLLDAIESAREDGLVATLVVRGGPPYGREAGALPGWAGPEIMAQAVSAFATLRSGPPYRPKPGLLLGLREYRSEVAEFQVGARLEVSVRESTRDEAGRAVFDSTLGMNGREIASGMLTVFQPDNVVRALEEQLA